MWRNGLICCNFFHRLRFFRNGARRHWLRCSGHWFSTSSGSCRAAIRRRSLTEHGRFRHSFGRPSSVTRCGGGRRVRLFLVGVQLARHAFHARQSLAGCRRGGGGCRGRCLGWLCAGGLASRVGATLAHALHWTGATCAAFRRRHGP